MKIKRAGEVVEIQGNLDLNATPLDEGTIAIGTYAEIKIDGNSFVGELAEPEPSVVVGYTLVFGESQSPFELGDAIDINFRHIFDIRA